MVFSEAPRDAGEGIRRASSRLEARLTAGTYCFGTGIRAMRLRACVSDHIALPVEGRNEHRTIVLIATWLVRREQRRLTTLGRHTSQPIAATAVAEIISTGEERNGINDRGR